MWIRLGYDPSRSPCDGGISGISAALLAGLAGHCVLTLDARQAEYRAALAESATRLGIAVHLEPTPINNQADVARWIQKVQAEKPHGVLVILQHFGTWSWASLVGKEAGVPVIIFSPIGMAFTGHVAGPARMSGVHVISSLEWSAVEEALKAIRAKRMFEETRVLLDSRQRACRDGSGTIGNQGTGYSARHLQPGI